MAAPGMGTGIRFLNQLVWREEALDMSISFDWPHIYGALLSQSVAPPKSAFAAARQMERDIFEESWPAGAVFADQQNLLRRYGFSRAILREAVRLLEDRGVARMRRGPGGGLVILPISAAVIVSTVTEYFAGRQVTADQLRQGRAALEIAITYRRCLGEGVTAVRQFTEDFRSRLRAAPGAGLLGAGTEALQRPRSSAGNAFTALFASCIDAIEERMHVPVHEDKAADGAGALPRTRRCRAHELARVLTLELDHAQVAGVARVGTARVGTARVGTAAELCERHNVGREVLGQAIRLLESRGVVDCQRGRTHGLHAGVQDAAALVERVVAYFSSIRLSWHELDGVARMLSRIVRMTLAAEATPSQRQTMLDRLDALHDWSDAPAVVTAQLHAEWAMVANPVLRFMEQCATAYYARVAGPVWPCLDDTQTARFRVQQRSYMEAIARGALVDADRLVEAICSRIDLMRDDACFQPATRMRVGA
jgi:DNA-binding FadR family transcriptional regulator